MRHGDALELGKALLVQWGLSDWSVVIDHSTRSRRLGYCSFGIREIGLSSWYVDHNTPEVVVETVKHEIAHALAWIKFGDTGHGAGWRRMCVEVGCTVSRTKDDDAFTRPPTRFRAVCPACKDVFLRNNRPRKGFVYYCPCQKDLPRQAKQKLVFGVNPALTEDVAKRAAERATNERHLEPVASDQVALLLKELTGATNADNQALAKNIRAKLRRLGHRGGLT